jgi:hypothetical protein
VPADDGADLWRVVKAVERRQEALARHLENARNTERRKLVDQDLSTVRHEVWDVR